MPLRVRSCYPYRVMSSTSFFSTPRLAAALAVLALGAGGGVAAGCGGDSQPTSDALSNTIESVTTAPQDSATETVPTEAMPASTTTVPTSATPSTVPSTTPQSATSTATTPSQTGTTPAETGGHAAPDTSTTATTPGSGTAQDPDCRPGTGPGQPDPQCEPHSGPDAQDEDPR